MQIAIASDSPSSEEASKPLPIAKPSGRLCIVRPINIISPVSMNLL